MGYAHFPVLVAIQCVVLRQAGPGLPWPGSRPSRRVGASGSSARHGAAIRPSARHDFVSRHNFVLR